MSFKEMDLAIYDAFIKGIILLSLSWSPISFYTLDQTKFKIGTWKWLPFEKWKKDSDEGRGGQRATTFSTDQLQKCTYIK